MLKTLIFILFSQLNPVIYHHAFSLEYSEPHEQPKCVSYMLCRSRAEHILWSRGNKFRSDPDVPTGSASPKDYVKSGFDKGHLAPSADFRWDSLAQTECFYMSNISPQKPKFNRGIWKRLEEQVREWAFEHDTLQIVVGPILRDKMATIGNNVAVPDTFFKAILWRHGDSTEAIGFLMANDSSHAELRDFSVPADSIESITGLDLFHEFTDSLEEIAEKTVNTKFWLK
jgi:endonuclease G, mitochondrial